METLIFIGKGFVVLLLCGLLGFGLWKFTRCCKELFDILFKDDE